MLKPLRRLVPALLCVALFATIAQAHFIFIAPEPAESPRSIKVYFSDAAEPDDPALLEGIVQAKAWLPGERGADPVPLTLKKEADADALTAELPAGTTRPILIQHVYGVSGRGEEVYLLNYYAKAYPSSLPGTWTAVNDHERLPLEVVPELMDGKMAFRVFWKGEPVSGSQVTVIGPGIQENLQGDTDAQGRYICDLQEGGQFSIRARLIQETVSGEFQGKPYPATRHYSTLVMNYFPAKLKLATHQWPALEKGITSFGSATVGDHLYVYGGHFGQAHHYSQEGQSGEFRRLNLANPASGWESLPGGPKLTGLALVAHNGKLYRIGGFTAKNTDAQEESLWSQNSFARFDPSQGQWEELAPLPEGRSSHDAAVVGDVLYVVGGWEMQPGAEAKWHKTAWSCDLSQPVLKWTALPEFPFERRAVSLAGWNGKLFVLGGMQSNDGITTAVAVYDPASRTWSSGPSLLGAGMDGFGTASFACNGQLFASTMSGSVQRLAADGSKWEFVSQLDKPRFFHRLLPFRNDLVFVGGASMSTGKITEFERLPTELATGR